MTINEEISIDDLITQIGQSQVTFSNLSAEADAEVLAVENEVDNRYSDLQARLSDNRDELSQLDTEIDEMVKNFGKLEDPVYVHTGIDVIDQQLASAIYESNDSSFTMDIESEEEVEEESEEEGIGY